MKGRRTRSVPTDRAYCWVLLTWIGDCPECTWSTALPCCCSLTLFSVNSPSLRVDIQLLLLCLRGSTVRPVNPEPRRGRAGLSHSLRARPLSLCPQPQVPLDTITTCPGAAGWTAQLETGPGVWGLKKDAPTPLIRVLAVPG